MEFLEAGKIINTHGLRGEVKVVAWMDSPDDFEKLESVYIGSGEGKKSYDVESVKYQKNNLIVKLGGVDNADSAQKLKNCILYAAREDLGELPEGVYYIADIIGLPVYDKSGELIGVVSDIFNTGSNDVYEIRREEKKALYLPMVGDCIAIDIENGRITVNIPEGLDE